MTWSPKEEAEVVVHTAKPELRLWPGSVGSGEALGFIISFCSSGVGMNFKVALYTIEFGSLVPLAWVTYSQGWRFSS